MREFDEKFVENNAVNDLWKTDYDDNNASYTEIATPSKIKSFITSRLTLQRKQMLEEVKKLVESGLKPSLNPSETSFGAGAKIGYEAAINDVLKALSDVLNALDKE